MPEKNLETVEPAVLDHEIPSRATEGVEAANRARRAFCDRVIHQSFDTRSGVDRGAGQKV